MLHSVTMCYLLKKICFSPALGIVYGREVLAKACFEIDNLFDNGEISSFEFDKLDHYKVDAPVSNVHYTHIDHRSIFIFDFQRVVRGPASSVIITHEQLFGILSRFKKLFSKKPPLVRKKISSSQKVLKSAISGKSG